MNGRLTIQELPTEIIELFFPYLNKKDIGNMMLVCKNFHSIFHHSFDIRSRLLQFVQNADYDKVKKMVKYYPALMFQTGYLDKSSETISPLKLALKLRDTHMCQIFLDAIQSIPDDPANPHLKEEMLEEFLKQAEEQKASASLNSYFKKCANYIKIYMTEIEKTDEAEADTDTVIEEDINKDQAQKAWLEIGEAQLKVVPRHILKELCRAQENPSDDPWAEQDFQTDANPSIPETCLIIDGDKMKEIGGTEIHYSYTPETDEKFLNKGLVQIIEEETDPAAYPKQFTTPQHTMSREEYLDYVNIPFNTCLSSLGKKYTLAKSDYMPMMAIGKEDKFSYILIRNQVREIISLIERKNKELKNLLIKAKAQLQEAKMEHSRVKRYPSV